MHVVAHQYTGLEGAFGVTGAQGTWSGRVTSESLLQLDINTDQPWVFAAASDFANGQFLQPGTYVSAITLRELERARQALTRGARTRSRVRAPQSAARPVGDMSFVVLVMILAPLAGFELGKRFAPHLVARLAFLPFGRHVVIALPVRASAVLLPPVEGTVTYRDLPARRFTLAALPGAARVTRDEQAIRFVPEVGAVLANPRWASSQLVRVDVSGDEGRLVLRARRYPSGELASMAILAFVVARWHLPSHWPALVAFCVAGGAIAMARSFRDAGKCFDAVVAEVRARVALANGELPPKPEPKATAVMMAARFTGPDAWECACGQVNARKRGMCRRCWAQRPEG
jgi:hypothetical protein